MTTRRVAIDGRWIGLRGADAADAANTATTDLMSILDTVEVPIVVVRRDLRIACFNQAAGDRLGLSPSDIGRASREISVLAGLPQLEALCTQAMASGVEHRADLRDGDKWLVVRISAYTRGDGQVSGTVLTFTNVTAFRASVDPAIYERESTKAILNAVADPLVVLSADERIQSGNRAFYALFGVSRDGTQGIRLHEFGNGAFELASLRKQLNEMLAGGHAFQPVEVDHVATGEGERTLLLDARPLAFPGHSARRVLLTFQDITARKQAEAAKNLRSEEDLRRSEAFLAKAQQLSSTGSFSWRVATDEITWSEQLYRTFQFDQGTTVTLERIGARVHREDMPLFKGMVDRARRAHGDFDCEYRVQLPDHSVKYLHVIAHGTRDRNGQLEYIGAAQDVTQRRLSEEALAKARSELAHVSRVSSLGAMTASIAHEVNQPLSGIITNAGTCLRMLAADPPNVDGARETARRTIRDGQRASEVITRLRGLFTKKVFATEHVDVNEAAREVIALSMSELQRGRVIVRSTLADNLPLVLGDRVQLQQVILNLITNALDAMRGVEDRPRELVVRTEPEAGGGVCLSVLDNGVGLDPSTVDRLFDAFYTTKSGGMGIGLSVSRSIVESHRGRLWATRNTGPGAAFSFSIPSELEGPTGARS
jgi:PAS domain S-box-containing protein